MSDDFNWPSRPDHVEPDDDVQNPDDVEVEADVENPDAVEIDPDLTFKEE